MKVRQRILVLNKQTVCEIYVIIIKVHVGCRIRPNINVDLLPHTSLRYFAIITTGQPEVEQIS